MFSSHFDPCLIESTMIKTVRHLLFLLYFCLAAHDKLVGWCFHFYCKNNKWYTISLHQNKTVNFPTYPFCPDILQTMSRLFVHAPLHRLYSLWTDFSEWRRSLFKKHLVMALSPLSSLTIRSSYISSLFFVYLCKK